MPLPATFTTSMTFVLSSKLRSQIRSNKPKNLVSQAKKMIKISQGSQKRSHKDKVDKKILGLTDMVSQAKKNDKKIPRAHRKGLTKKKKLMKKSLGSQIWSHKLKKL